MNRLRQFVSMSAAIVAAFMLFIATFSVVVQIIMRYQNNPNLWSIELSQFAVIAMVFIGAAAAARDRQHFRIDYIAGLVGRRTEKWFDVVSRLVGLATLAVLGLYAIRMLESVMNTYSTAAQIPVRYVYYLMIYGIVSWIILLLLEFFIPDADDPKGLETARAELLAGQSDKAGAPQ
ncbi:TRAP transporter small permease [Pseudohoeflea coraliihabitans]|uniref:TRAP transporter small permease protein n=1 Tax=Pseudohoeflea coraliihabitans TaxID=2860393 RepID=A0ABS6WPP2_9HYPH|nr:TRAP transporter small permease [Pseudohoeflea sp. DP4N28-3]MBW3097050.1 TRAP transporter small permease [Pseudohoeflea sp. DP4N28-3]